MKLIIRVFILILMYLSISFNIYAKNILLKDVLKKAIQTDVSIKNLSVQEKIDGINMEIAKKKKLLSVNLSGRYLFQSDKMEINLPSKTLSPTITIPGSTMSAGVNNNFDINMSIIQPVYSGGIISNNIKLKKNDLSITKNNKLLSKQIISRNIKNSYFKYKILNEEKKILTTLLNKLELHKKKIQDLYNENLINKAVILETEIKKDEIKLNLEELNKQLKTEQIQFNYLTKVNISDIEKNYSEIILNKNNSLAYYKRNHPLLNNIKIGKDNLYIGENINRGSYLPQINSFFELHYGKPGIDFFKNEWNPYFRVGINISYRLFDWNTKKSNTNILIYRRKKLENKRGHLIELTENNLNILYTSMNFYKNKIAKIKSLIMNSEAIKNIKEKLFLEKQITNLEYLTFLQKIKKYKLMEQKNKYKIELIKTRINALIGKI